MKINFGKEGVIVQQATKLVQDEIKGLTNISYEVPRTLLVELEKLEQKFGNKVRVLYVEIGAEEYTNFRWNKERVEMIGHVPYTIAIDVEGSTRIEEGEIQYGGNFFTEEEIESVQGIINALNDFSFKILTEYLTENRLQLTIDSKDTQKFIHFLTEKLYAKANEIATEFPWYLWVWDGIHQYSSAKRLHTSLVPSPIAKLFFFAVGMTELKDKESIDIDEADQQHTSIVNTEKFRRSRVAISYICQQSYYLNSLSFAADNFSKLNITLPGDSKRFSFYGGVVPDFTSKGTGLNFMRAINLNIQRSSFSGGYTKGFSWFFVRTYVNMLLSYFDTAYRSGPPKNIPLHELARAFLPIRDALLKETGIEVEHLICVIGAYLNFFNEWLKKSIEKSPDFIPFFTLSKDSLLDIDSILGLTGHLKILKSKLNNGELPKKYDKANIPTDWVDIIQNIHEKLSLGKQDVESLDVTNIEKPYLFFKFSDGQFIVCCIDLLLGIESVLNRYSPSGEFGRVKGKMFEEISSLFPSELGWSYGRNMKINDVIGQKVGTDLDVFFLKPPYMVIGSCKTEGSEKVFQIKNEKDAFERWDEVVAFIKDIDDLATWLNKSLEQKNIRASVCNALKSAGQTVKEPSVADILNQVRFIIPVVITPGTEFILDISNHYMLTDWIPRICTPKELVLYLSQLTQKDVKEDYIIKRDSGEQNPPQEKNAEEGWRFEEVWTRLIIVMSRDRKVSAISAFDFDKEVNLVLQAPRNLFERALLGRKYIAKIGVYITKTSEDMKGEGKTDEAKPLARPDGTGENGFMLKLMDIQPFAKPQQIDIAQPMLYQPTFKRSVDGKTIDEWNEKHPYRKTDLQLAPKTTRQCKICKKYFSRTDDELVAFLQPIYPTDEMGQMMQHSPIESLAGDLFVCSRCALIRRNG